MTRLKIDLGKAQPHTPVHLHPSTRDSDWRKPGGTKRQPSTNLLKHALHPDVSDAQCELSVAIAHLNAMFASIAVRRAGETNGSTNRAPPHAHCNCLVMAFVGFDIKKRRNPTAGMSNGRRLFCSPCLHLSRQNRRPKTVTVRN